MARRRNVAAALLLVLGAGAGCAPQLEHIEGAIDNNSAEIQTLSDEQKVLKRDLEATLELLRGDQGSGLETDARLQAQLQQVLTRLDQISQKQDDNQEFMRNLSARVDLLATRLGVPTLGEFKPAPEGGADLEALPEEGRAIFNAAMLDRNRGNADVARQGFQEFLDRYPNSELADDAQYWLGAMAEEDGDHEGALKLLLPMLDKYPQSDRRSDALLKAITACHELGRDDQARSLLQKLQTEFPGSENAALAASLLSG